MVGLKARVLAALLWKSHKRPSVISSLRACATSSLGARRVAFTLAIQGYAAITRSFLKTRVCNERKEEHADKVALLGALAALRYVREVGGKNQRGRGEVSGYRLFERSGQGWVHEWVAVLASCGMSTH